MVAPALDATSGVPVSNTHHAANKPIQAAIPPVLRRGPGHQTRRQNNLCVIQVGAGAVNLGKVVATQGNYSTLSWRSHRLPTTQDCELLLGPPQKRPGYWVAGLLFPDSNPYATRLARGGPGPRVSKEATQERQPLLNIAQVWASCLVGKRSGKGRHARMR